MIEDRMACHQVPGAIIEFGLEWQFYTMFAHEEHDHIIDGIFQHGAIIRDQAHTRYIEAIVAHAAPGIQIITPATAEVRPRLCPHGIGTTAASKAFEMPVATLILSHITRTMP